MIELKLPLKHILITQSFGKNFVDFYSKLGMIGHNGIDFKAKNGCPCYASHTGTISYSGVDGDGGISVQIWNKEEKYKTIYYHLKETIVNENDEVQAGQMIGYCDNTGKYTTGDHLHFGFKLVDFFGKTLNCDNGFFGAINPVPFFPKDFEKSNAYKRYGRIRDWKSFKIEVRIMKELVKYLKRLPTHEQINACTYGGWDREIVANDAMFELWGYLTKSDYMLGKVSFQ